MTEGYAIHWYPWEDPFMVHPSGRVIKLYVDDFIPYVDDEASVLMPLVSGVARSSSDPFSGR